jgi:hypothetical protein
MDIKLNFNESPSEKLGKKLSLRLIRHLAMKIHMGGGGEWSNSSSSSFTLVKRVLGINWTGAWLRPGANLDAVAKKKSMPLPRIDLGSSSH